LLFGVHHQFLRVWLQSSLSKHSHKPFAMKKILFVLTYAVIAGAIGMLLVNSASGQSSSVTNLTLDELDGTTSKLSDYLRNGPVHMTFWALWCVPCKEELRALKSFAKEHADDPFTILAVNQDSPKSLAKVKAYVKSQGYPFPVILDPNTQLFQALNGQNLPFSVLIDKFGKIVSTRTGYLPGDEKEIQSDILKLITKE
jgi:cytochrome c biogenesis protein CcmG, thiol:disulfide interchange protein DsbE